MGFPRLFAVFRCALLLSLTAALLPDPSTTNSSTKRLISLEHLRLFTESSNGDVTNNATSHLAERTGCYMPALHFQVVPPQDALIMLGRLASSPDFSNQQKWQDFALLTVSRSAELLLVKIGEGYDEFSILDVASQAMDVIKFCIIQQPPHLGFGGAIEVGSRNNFRVVVQSRIPHTDNLSATS